jgi:hypothetical protein
MSKTEGLLEGNMGKIKTLDPVVGVLVQEVIEGALLNKWIRAIKKH